MILPLTVKFKVWTIACDRLWSKEACVVASRLAVVKVPPNKLPEVNDLVIKPPLAGNSPVSLRIPSIPETVPVTDVPRPLKFGVEVGVGVGVGTGVGVGVGVAVGVGVGVGVGVTVGVGVGVGVPIQPPKRATTELPLP